MLVAFALANYTCYRDRQEFSAEAVARTGAASAFDTGVRRFPRLNRVSAIYGSNGSGKSRFVQALAFAKSFVVGSSKESQTGADIPYRPFLFDAKTRGQPTTFELSFIEAGTVYEYGFAIDRRRVHAEWLLAWPPGGRMRHLLERTYDSDTDSERWAFGASVRGPKEVWRSSTRPNSLLVSAAAQLNSEPFRPVVDWCRKLNVLTAGDIPPYYTASMITENENSRGALRRCSVMRTLPSPISPSAQKNMTDQTRAPSRKSVSVILIRAQNLFIFWNLMKNRTACSGYFP